MFFEPTNAWPVSRRLLFRRFPPELTPFGPSWCSKTNEKGLLEGSFRLELEPTLPVFDWLKFEPECLGCAPIVFD
jgi:hypothetical protein